LLCDEEATEEAAEEDEAELVTEADELGLVLAVGVPV